MTEFKHHWNIMTFHREKLISITDDFSWTSLDSTKWDSKLYTSWTITVNNWLTLSWWTSWSQTWPLVYTKKTFTGNEKKITAELAISSEWWTYLEARRWILPDIAYTYPLYIISQCVSTYNNTTRVGYQNSSTWEAWFESQSIVSRPYTLKMILDCVWWTWEVYVNDTLYYSWSVWYALSNCIWRPIFWMAATSWTSVSCTISSVKVTIE